MKEITREPTTVSAQAEDRLMECITKARGFLFLVANVYVKSDERPINEPDSEEKEGVLWLASSVGQDLNEAFNAAFKCGEESAASKDASITRKGGAE